MKLVNRNRPFARLSAFIVLLIPIITYMTLFIFDYLVGLQLNHIYLFFIIPLGGFVIGMIYGMVYPITMVLLNLKKSWYQYVIHILVTLLLTLGMFYMYYLVSYIEDGSLNSRFQGVHISEYLETETGESQGFISSTLYYIDSMNFGPTKYRIRKYAGTVQSSFFNRFITSVQLVGILLGSLGMYRIIINEHIYCGSCQRYMQRINLFKIDANDETTLNAIYYYFHQGDITELKKLLTSFKYKNKLNASLILTGTYFECADQGKLVIRKYTVKKGMKTYIKDSMIRYNVKKTERERINEVLRTMNLEDTTHIF